MQLGRRHFTRLAALLALGTVTGCASQPEGATGSGDPRPGRTTAAAAPTAEPRGVLPTPAADLHFAVASDGHFGEPGTDFARRFAELVTALNAAHRALPLDFVVINGDISHGGVALAEGAKAALASLDMPLFVTQGNHDQLSAQQWQQVWGAPGNQVHRFGERSIVLANTSNAAGDYLCADTDWLAQALQAEAAQRDIFVFFHITAKKWTKHGVDCPEVRALLARTPHVRAVFNAHDHDQLGVKIDVGLSYFFDGHFGGSWGAPQRSYRDVLVSAGGLTTTLIGTDGPTLGSESLSW
jgi:3',5'-cyclic-AMP phosphodiesterase